MTKILCYGVAVHDMIFRVNEMPHEAVKYRANDFATVVGGMAANAAIAIARLGGHASIATGLGNDRAGLAILDDLKSEGVDCSFTIQKEGATSPLSAVLVDRDGERMLVNYRDPQLDDPLEFLPETLAGFSAVMSDNRWENATQTLLERAQEFGLPAILDVDKPPETTGSLALASHVAFSAVALRGLTGQDDLGEGLRSARRFCEGEISVTDGANGVTYLDGDTVHHIPSFDVEAVDTLGAGDVFHGALALAIAEGASHVKALQFASATAALKCTQFGGSKGTPHRHEVDQFLGAFENDQ